MDKSILWYTLCEAIDQLQAQGIKFKVNPNEIMDRWTNDEDQSRINTGRTEDGEIYIEIKEEE